MPRIAKACKDVMRLPQIKSRHAIPALRKLVPPHGLHEFPSVEARVIDDGHRLVMALAVRAQTELAKGQGFPAPCLILAVADGLDQQRIPSNSAKFLVMPLIPSSTSSQETFAHKTSQCTRASLSWQC